MYLLHIDPYPNSVSSGVVIYINLVCNPIGSDSPPVTVVCMSGRIIFMSKLISFSLRYMFVISVSTFTLRRLFFGSFILYLSSSVGVFVQALKSMIENITRSSFFVMKIFVKDEKFQDVL